MPRLDIKGKREQAQRRREASRLMDALARRGVSNEEVAYRLGLSAWTTYRWQRGNAPSTTRLIQLRALARRHDLLPAA